MKGCIRLPNGFMCSRDTKPKPCVKCGGPSAFLCDAKPPKSNKRSCDAPICAKHATQIGPDRHQCPACAAATPATTLHPQRPLLPKATDEVDEINECDFEPAGPPPPKRRGSPWATPIVSRPKEPDPWIALLAECPAKRGREEHAGHMHVAGWRDVHTGDWPGLPRRERHGVSCTPLRTLERAEQTTEAFERLVRAQESATARAKIRDASIQASVRFTDPERRKAFIDEYAPNWTLGPDLHLPPREPPLLLHKMQSDIGRDLDRLAENNARHQTANPNPQPKKPKCRTSSSQKKSRVAAA